MKARELTKKEKRELAKKFPVLKRKKIKQMITAIKNYDNIVAMLFKAERKNILMEEIIEQLKVEIKLNNLDRQKLIEKLEDTEKRRRKNAGAIGGLTAKVNSLKEEKELFKTMFENKEEDLKKSLQIIKEQENEIKRLKRRPTMQELIEYDRTRKSPRKKKKDEEKTK